MIEASRVIVTASIFAALALPAGPALAQDVADSKDHALVSRYAGSSIVWYDLREYDEFTLLLGPVVEDGSYPNRRRLSESRALEGKVTKISYHLPGDRSTLEVLRNYERELTAAGFDLLFSCSNPDCGGRVFNYAALVYAGGFAGNHRDHRYLAARRATPEGDVHLSLYVVRNTSEGGRSHNQINYQLTVVESEPMDVDMVTVDAATMALEIAETGSVSLYGVYFDTDKSEVKPESSAALEQIAKLLEADGALRLFVVGHTDNVGALDYNMDLSSRRAAAVVEAMVTGYGVDAARLTPRGVGPLAPVAANGAESGRALNRRVELVAR